MSRFLLPHKFKIWGAFMFPLGSLIFTGIHFLGIYFNDVVKKVDNIYWSIALTLCFFSALIGLVFVVFSKEKNEDEYIKRLRLESLQISALLQLLYLIYSFIRLAFYKGHSEQEYMVFMFVRILFVFWLAYIIRYNFILLYNKYRLRNEK